MSLSVGIVGLPNVGKSTLFNALLKKQLAYAANFPFATIEPNIGVVPVPDDRLEKLAHVIKENHKMSELPPLVPATVEFLDIAGLIAGAHKGEGLGNKFLAHIREVDAICHVVRVFKNENIIKEGSVDPVSDFETIKTELAMADLTTLEKQKDPKLNSTKEEKTRWNVVVKFKEAINASIDLNTLVLTEEEQKQANQLSLLSTKPILVVLNVDDTELKNASEIEKEFSQKLNVSVDQVIAVCAKVEEELASFTELDAVEYLSDLGVEKSGLERIIKKAFHTLGLITFLTAGEKEIRAWTIPLDTLAKHAAGVIHTDFEKKFIKADVVKFEDFIEFKGWKGAREKGKVGSEGKEYVVKDGDVIEFKIGA